MWLNMSEFFKVNLSFIGDMWLVAAILDSEVLVIYIQKVIQWCERDGFGICCMEKSEERKENN